jgi:multidrug efflux pump
MWNFFLTNNRFAYLLVVVLIVVGSYSLLSIPRESTPEVEIPVGVVVTALPGAPAADIEALVTNELETSVQNIENVKKVTSTSRNGVSSITVEFEASADLDESIQDLKDAIDRAKSDLPDDATEPQVTQIDFVNQPILTVAIANDTNDRAFADLATSLEDELEKVPGVSDVVIAGVQTPEITVLVDNAALTQFSISVQDVTNAIQNANIALPIGSIEHDSTSYNIAFEGKPKNAADIENIAITTRGGQSVLVRDVATVIDGLSERTALSRLSVDGAPSLQSMSVSIYKQSGGDITRIAADTREAIAALQAEGELLEGSTVEILSDMGKDINDDLVQLATSGLQTVILVFIALVLAIGWREGLIAGTAIPLSFLIGFIGLYYSGNTINFLSLFSLILGIGILVDSAIVMVEGINRRMKEDVTIDKKEAARKTVSDFAAPLTSGTLTTIAMFVGLFIVSGITGQFIESIPFTLIFLLTASLFVSLFIVPLFASNFLRRRNATRFEAKQVEYAHALETWYKNKLGTILGDRKKEKRFMWSIRTLLVVALLLPVFGVVKVVFFESSDMPYLFIDVEMQAGTTKERTDIVARQVEDILYSEQAIASFRTTVGSGNEYTGGGDGEKLANFFVLLDEDRNESSLEIAARLQEKVIAIPNAQIDISQPDSGPPTGAPILVKFIGDDIAELTDAANDAGELLRQMPGTKNVTSDTNNSAVEYLITLQNLKASSLGLNAVAVSSALRAATFGADATSLTSLSDDIDVIVKRNIPGNTDPTRTNETTIDNVLRTEIATPNGVVPLSSITTVSLQSSNEVITHEGGKRVITLEGEVTGDGNALEITAELLSKIENELDLPPSVTVSTGGGEAEETNKAFMEMFAALVAGVLLMICVLVLQFNSYLHTRYVLSILPYSLIGIMAGLALTGNALSFPSLMGFIALSGIVVNNSILLIDTMNQMRKERPEAELRDIVLDGATNRLRPILLTTITTVLGMIPLTYADPVWAPLAFAVMFGLIFSVVITLVLIPIVYFKKPGALLR